MALAQRPEQPLVLDAEPFQALVARKLLQHLRACARPHVPGRSGREGAARQACSCSWRSAAALHVQGRHLLKVSLYRIV